MRIVVRIVMRIVARRLPIRTRSRGHNGPVVWYTMHNSAAVSRSRMPELPAMHGSAKLRTEAYLTLRCYARGGLRCVVKSVVA
jgi:hypothetical protein